MKYVSILIASLIATACGGGGESAINTGYNLGGTVVGLSDATGLILSIAGESLAIAPNETSFLFKTKLVQGSHYSVAIQTQPIGRTCSLRNGAGAIVSVDVSTVVVSCFVSGTVTTFAGTGSAGFLNGTGTVASFSNPFGVAFDKVGNMYVADYKNHAVRKITSDGVVTTLAGTGSPGFVNGLGTTATFNNPAGVAVDSLNNVYVADSNNLAIRKITPTGIVSTFAGTGGIGFVDGVGTAASFKFPMDIAIDNADNLFVADSQNHAIRKITSNGVVTTLAGTGSAGFVNGVGTSASFSEPNGVAVDSAGAVYVAEVGNDVIRKITPTGNVSTLAGTGLTGFANGVGSTASFHDPFRLAIDNFGSVYVADTNNNVIRKISSSGVVSTFAGSGAGFINGVGMEASFAGPLGLAIDDTGNVFVSEAGNEVIRKITP